MRIMADLCHFRVCIFRKYTERVHEGNTIIIEKYDAAIGEGC